MMRRIWVLVAGCAVIAGCSSVTAGVAGEAPSPITPAAPASACDPAVIADDLGRPLSQVNVYQCLGDWALLDNGGEYGDTSYLARAVAGRWVAYTHFPTSVCRAEAAQAGTPDEVLGNFSECEPSRTPATVDLGLSTPISSPSCDGAGIVILRSAVDPANYARDVRQALDANPGASYLRTDRSCPSLSPVDANGNAIYAVYLPAGRGKAAICGALGQAPSGAYAKVLDTTTDPSKATVTC